MGADTIANLMAIVIIPIKIKKQKNKKRLDFCKRKIL